MDGFTIDAGLVPQLQAVAPSFDDYGTEYRPCRVTLRSGVVIDRACVAKVDQYRRVWGPLPGDDPARKSVPVEDVVRIESSPYRLPAHLATRLYAAGESGMGYVIFTVVLRDGRRLSVLTGNLVDFPALPPGVHTDDIVDAVPHEGREHLQSEEISDYTWVLYRLPGENGATTWCHALRGFGSLCRVGLRAGR